jgi:hypothetical protein
MPLLEYARFGCGLVRLFEYGNPTSTKHADHGQLQVFAGECQGRHPIICLPYRTMSGYPWPDMTSLSVTLPDNSPYAEPPSQSPQQASAEVDSGANLSLSSGRADSHGPVSSQSKTSKNHRTSLPTSSSPTPAQAHPTSSLSQDMPSLSLTKFLTKRPGAIPPELPPSVEAAYRKKCIQLKQRMNEVEEANDAARQRLARINRSIQKMRLERAFLLEQLAKRTSTNVEDSEGSPSPPPTVRCTPPSLLFTCIDHSRQANDTTLIAQGETPPHQTRPPQARLPYN